MPITSFEFLIPRRPVSVQAKKGFEQWKAFIKSEAQKVWSFGSPIKDTYLQLTLVYLCSDDNPPDTDNIIKLIQDALIGLVYENDSLVLDVESHRRFLSEPIDITNLPSLLQQGVITGKECVYVKVSESQPLEKYL
ncbi:RusA family crossover junction endodeoxyribonuclease [Sphaerospermopsis aphanizomenoides BCCUSP55]|uniref:RusA family crossover junction endodeoxyribonuclease n=1 Tax=Sphaerospermopsis aphanizomenoides TaxID=459663 RepID=UPI0019069995|nr:RusA family crossover junction endodeoxyribonuclease [Sphaerospermopsis aphanizomenoides]MBK1987875.1 RusA family crossover junction endodeoxyribonuclease [Sphaerospermopsis aphanizomenoides BCCUSP55]